MDDNRRVSESEVTIRRAPKIGVFLVLGAVLGAIVTLVLTSLFPADENVGFLASYAYFCLFGIPAGLLLGAIVALVLEAVSRRRVRTVTVERSEVGDPE
jgi:ABC-type Co2+ transport system permease subunit